MLLHCTLVRGPSAALQGPPLELTIEGPQVHPGPICRKPWPSGSGPAECRSTGRR